jgi:hypothetical protein
MEMLSDFFLEIIFRRMIVGIFGYYTLLFIYTLLGHKKGKEWLRKSSKDDGDEFGKGWLLGLVGIVSFSLIFVLIGLIYDRLFG